jgi:hypothetical protein
MTILRSIALSMSNRVRQATETAVSASISTPVAALVRTCADTRKPGRASSASMLTSMPVSGSGWHRGISSAVRLAAMIPASSAVAITAPFGAVPERTASSASSEQVSVPVALAVRAVSALSDMSTMRARPSPPTWLSLLTPAPAP